MSSPRPRRSASSPVEPPDQALRAELTEQMQTFQARVDAFDEAAAQLLDVPRTDLRCIEILARDGTAAPGSLGSALGLTSGGVTAMLNRLERRGYLRRSPDPADGRRVSVALTPAALRRVGQLYGPIAAEGADMLGGYTSDQLRLLAHFLRLSRELYERHLTRVRTPDSLR